MPPPGTWCDDGRMHSSDPKLLDTAKRSAADVLQDHLQLREAAELEADLRRNYATDVALLSGRGVLRGHDTATTYGVQSRELSLTWDAATQSLETARRQ
jgi:hypothetical protein